MYRSRGGSGTLSKKTDKNDDSVYVKKTALTLIVKRQKKSIQLLTRPVSIQNWEAGPPLAPLHP